MVEISPDVLAKLAGTEVSVIEAFENGLGKPNDEIIARLQRALEDTGATFLYENRAGEGAGVRLKFDRSSTRRIAVLEGEGGVVAPDDVP
ncbi:helix-turn-helix domain-containing protein [Pseudorhizobium marinum]|uniref:XRE family transcriptional regulator n=1 Tax=Pseudorhizobium marinum TaxID=1496690 RepID=UPI000A5696DE|nr:XRE family transcriptional regulator [Pseudorhizobium marinum]